MPLYARRMINVHGSVGWILHDEGIAHPLIVLSDIELQRFLADIESQKEQAKEYENQRRRKK